MSIEKHAYCMKDGDLFIDNHFVAQLCWDEESVIIAIQSWQNMTDQECEDIAQGYIHAVGNPPLIPTHEFEIDIQGNIVFPEGHCILG